MEFRDSGFRILLSFSAELRVNTHRHEIGSAGAGSKNRRRGEYRKHTVSSQTLRKAELGFSPLLTGRKEEKVVPAPILNFPIFDFL
jgi:hypothetical protein